MVTEMIDWLTFSIPCFHKEEINGGCVISIDPSGETNWTSKKHLHVTGSHESSIQVKTDYESASGDAFTALRVHGNPVKWLQGHNIFGTNDIQFLLNEVMTRLSEILPVEPTELDKQAWLNGHARLTRVDINRAYDLGDRKTVLEWLHHAQLHATMAYRGKGIMTGDTLYFGKHSKDWTLKGYSKGQEIERNKVAIEVLTESMKEWANSKLRIELTLRGRELKKLGLANASNWKENDTSRILEEYMSRLSVASRIKMTHTELEKLPARLRLAYQGWKDGNDLKKTLPKRTYYRYKKELAELGIDITIPQTKKTPNNVLPFVRVLEAKPCQQVPDWATGTKLFLTPN